MVIFTSSWDDGSVYDMKLAEILKRYRQRATFYIPLANKAREVITSEQIVFLSRDFEIGAHTLNHSYLTFLSNHNAEKEIKLSKNELESITGKPINGFCFPGGKFRAVHIKYAKEAGYKYVRTTNMFKTGNDPFMMNTTLQAYNHTRITYLRHMLKRGYFNQIIQNAGVILRNPEWDKLLLAILKNNEISDSGLNIKVIHLWGHSYELQANNSWKKLGDLFNLLNDFPVVSKTNYDAYRISQRSLEPNFF
jgi:hypothetical protein